MTEEKGGKRVSAIDTLRLAIDEEFDIIHQGGVTDMSVYRLGAFCEAIRRLAGDAKDMVPDCCRSEHVLEKVKLIKKSEAVGRKRRRSTGFEYERGADLGPNGGPPPKAH